MSFKSNRQRKGFFASIKSYQKSYAQKKHMSELEHEKREKMTLAELERRQNLVMERDRAKELELESRVEREKRLEELRRKQAEARQYLFEHSFAGRVTKGYRTKQASEKAYYASPEGQEELRERKQQRAKNISSALKKGEKYLAKLMR